MNTAEAIQKIPQQLSELAYLDVLAIREGPYLADPGKRPDLEIKAGTLTFLVEYKPRSTAEAVGSALLQIRSWTTGERPDDVVTLLVVPYMGEVGRHLCEGAGVNWMDLSGNASIRAPGINVNVTGLPNKYVARGRPPNIFAPKAARLARAFLMHPKQGWLHQDLAKETQLSKGYVSKILVRLEEAGFAEKRDEQRYWPRNVEAMLDAWRESYDFSNQQILKGHVAERTPEAVVRRSVDGLSGIAVRTAVTGLAAAWFYDKHAAFRLCSLYVAPTPEPSQLIEWGFREVESGANTWLVQPADEGVFTGVTSGDGMPYVSPLQAYLDLKQHPERAQEAADVLRPRVLEGVG